MGAAAFTFNEELQQQSRFSDREFSARTESRLPPKPKSHDSVGHTCPYCDQQLPEYATTIFSVFGGGVHRLLVAVSMIASAALRCVRFIVGAALCFLGLFGTCCRVLGERIAHPDDRRFLSPRCARGRG